MSLAGPAASRGTTPHRGCGTARLFAGGAPATVRPVPLDPPLDTTQAFAGLSTQNPTAVVAAAQAASASAAAAGDPLRQQQQVCGGGRKATCKQERSTAGRRGCALTRPLLSAHVDGALLRACATPCGTPKP